MVVMHRCDGLSSGLQYDPGVKSRAAYLDEYSNIGGTNNILE